jgi:hypothetical protein
METFLEGLLDHVADEYGKAHPIAAEAAQATTPRRVRRSNRTAGRASGSAARSLNPALARVASKQAQRRGGSAGPPAPATNALPGQYEGEGQSPGIDEFLRD